jgi:hypothetical protein
MTDPMYTEELAQLARQAARLHMFIDLTEPDHDLGLFSGPFVLRHANGEGAGY